MNERIRLISDREIRIVAIGNRVVGYHITDSGVVKAKEVHEDAYYAVGTTDGPGREACIDAFNCLRDTGSFAALADTSPVPYTGKRMRTGNGREVVCCTQQKPGPSNNPHWYAVDDAGGWNLLQVAGCLYPLSPPKPMVRPYTPVEAAAYIGRKALSDHHEYHVEQIRNRIIGLSSKGVSPTYFRTFEQFAMFNWADDGTPCGVVE